MSLSPLVRKFNGDALKNNAHLHFRKPLCPLKETFQNTGRIFKVICNLLLPPMSEHAHLTPTSLCPLSLEQRNQELQVEVVQLKSNLAQQHHWYQAVQAKIAESESARAAAERRNATLQREMEQFFDTFGELNNEAKKTEWIVKSFWVNYEGFSSLTAEKQPNLYRRSHTKIIDVPFISWVTATGLGCFFFFSFFFCQCCNHTRHFWKMRSQLNKRMRCTV